jgi:hypothetical protein
MTMHVVRHLYPPGLAAGAFGLSCDLFIIRWWADGPFGQIRRDFNARSLYCRWIFAGALMLYFESTAILVPHTSFHQSDIISSAGSQIKGKSTSSRDIDRKGSWHMDDLTVISRHSD